MTKPIKQKLEFVKVGRYRFSRRDIQRWYEITQKGGIFLVVFVDDEQFTIGNMKASEMDKIMGVE